MSGDSLKVTKSYSIKSKHIYEKSYEAICIFMFPSTLELLQSEVDPGQAGGRFSSLEALLLRYSPQM